MTEKKSRGQPKFEPTQDQRNQVKLMKAVGIPEDRICKTITNPRTRKPVAPIAGSWSKPRRVVAKVEWHPGELRPRQMFAEILSLIARLRAPPAPA